MTNAHVAGQRFHVSLLEHISDQAVGFPLVELFTFTGHNTSCILATVL
jgi:hypothetical protein